MKRLICLTLIVVMVLLTEASCKTSETQTSVRGEKPEYTYSVLDEKKQSPSDVYTVPWNENASETAVRTGTIRYYFMSGEKRKYSESAGIKFGDSCLIAFPNGQVMLIDGGMPGYAPILVQNLKLLGVKKIDYVVLSHMHDDHYGGLLSPAGVLANFEIGTFFWGGTYNISESVADRFDSAMKKYNVNGVILLNGDTLDIGSVHIDIFNPNMEDVGDRYAEAALNNASVTMKIAYDEFSAVFAGDLYSDGEYKVLAYAADKLDADLIKANHHGRTTSNTKEWGAATTPRVVVATSGNPIDETVYAWYSKVGARVFNDNIDSYVRVVSDGWNCSVTTARARKTKVFEFYDKIAGQVYPE